MANTVKRVTKKDYFAGLRNIVETVEVENRDELLAFIDREIELLTKKNVAKGPTKKQVENMAFVEDIYEALRERGEAMTIAEIQEANTELAGLTSQKISALLKKLVDAKRVTKTIDKKKTYYLAV